MKFIKYVVLFAIFVSVSCCKKNVSEILPEYKVVKIFSKKMNLKTGLILSSYGVNNSLPKGYKPKNGVGNFNVTFSLPKTRKDMVSLEEARCLVVSVEECFLQEINSNLEVRPLLDFYPFTSDLVNIRIRFEDENQIDLGSGISGAYLSNGTIKYERYDIHEYRSKYPSIGEHFTVHTESYAEALDIVKNKGCTIDFHASALMPESCSDFFLPLI